MTIKYDYEVLYLFLLVSHLQIFLPLPRRRFGPVGPETVDGSAPRWRHVFPGRDVKENHGVDQGWHGFYMFYMFFYVGFI